MGRARTRRHAEERGLVTRWIYWLRRCLLELHDAWTHDTVSAAWLAEQRQAAARDVVWRDMPAWKWPVEWPK